MGSRVETERHIVLTSCHSLLAILVFELIDALLQEAVQQVRAVDSTDGDQQLELRGESRASLHCAVTIDGAPRKLLPLTATVSWANTLTF